MRRASANSGWREAAIRSRPGNRSRVEGGKSASSGFRLIRRELDRPDRLHLPGVEFFQNGILSLSADGDSHTILAARIDAHREIELSIDEDFHNAAINEHAQPQGLAWSGDG